MFRMKLKKLSFYEVIILFWLKYLNYSVEISSAFHKQAFLVSSAKETAATAHFWKRAENSDCYLYVV